MHLFDVERCFMGGHGIVGAQMPLAAGIGWKIHYREEDRVVLCFMGDAAVNQGAFHEALNMSAVWKLPVIYVVENNEYGMGTAFSRVSVTPVSEKSLSYGIPATIVDGQDVLETYVAFSRLAEEVRGGGGPRFVDLQTYRFKGHSMSDPVSGTYRSKSEVEGKVKKADPIALLRHTLTAAGLLTDEELQEIDAGARDTALKAFEYADESPFPDESELYADVYGEINPGRLFLDGRERSEGGS